jgi:hypothetical protein
MASLSFNTPVLVLKLTMPFEGHFGRGVGIIDPYHCVVLRHASPLGYGVG